MSRTLTALTALAAALALAAPAAQAQTSTTTLTFSAEGAAAAPFPGTFTETGTVRLRQEEGLPGLSLVGFEATFTIDSASGQVTGTKTFTGTDTSGGGNACFEDASSGTRQVVVNSGDLTYQATIVLPSGETITDSGTSGLNLAELTFGGNTVIDQFTESLLSTDPLGPFQPPVYLTATGPGVTINGSCAPMPDPPQLPTTREECKKFAFENFPEVGFKNQGDCVAFVETEGTNEPGQNVP